MAAPGLENTLALQAPTSTLFPPWKREGNKVWMGLVATDSVTPPFLV